MYTENLCKEIALEAVKICSEGQTFYRFEKRVATMMRNYGYDGWSLEGMKRNHTRHYKRAYQHRVLLKIYQAILMLRYHEKRYTQLIDGKFAYWIYRTTDCECPLHSEWDGLILSHNHPFWQTHYPPNGWGCSCYVNGADSKKIALRLGGKGRHKLPDMWHIRNPKTGAHLGVDEGWNIMVGEKKPLDIEKEVWSDMNKGVAFYRPQAL